MSTNGELSARQRAKRERQYAEGSQGADLGGINSGLFGRISEAQRQEIERGAKPGPIARWAGYALGIIIALGGTTIVAILIIKGILWAWSL